MKRIKFLTKTGLLLRAIPMIVAILPKTALHESHDKPFDSGNWSSVRNKFSLTPSRIHLATFLIAALLSGSCKGDPTGSGPNSPVQLEPTGPVTATIDAIGGTISAVTEEGVLVTLNFPAGSVREATEISIRPLESTGGLWMHVALEPAGMVFRKPFTVIVTLPPEAEQLNGTLILGSAGAATALATTANPTARTLSTDALTFFGFPAIEVVSSESSLFGIESLKMVPDEEISTGVLMQVDNAGEGGNTLGVLPKTCSQLSDEGRIAFDAAVASGTVKDAINASLAVGAALFLSACGDEEGYEWVEQAMTTACGGLEDTLSEIAASPFTRYGQYEEEIRKVIVWRTLLQKLQGECNADWIDALEAKSEDLVRFAGERAAELVAHDFHSFALLRLEARALLTAMGTAQLAGLDEAFVIIENQALRPVLNLTRTTAYALCRAGEWHYPLSRLTPVGFFGLRDIVGVAAPRPSGPTWPPPDDFADFTTAQIHEDLQYCGTEVTLQGLVQSGGGLDPQQVGSLGNPGEFVDDVVLELPTRGKFQLSGDLQAFVCWNDIPADQSIVIEVNNQLAHTLTRSNDRYIGEDPIELDIAQLAEKAEIIPKQGTSAQLRFVRIRDQCNHHLWGPEKFELFTATLEWRNPTLEVEVRLPDAAPGADVEAEVRVKVVDQHGEGDYFDDIEVELEVEGGTPLQASGRTNAEGYFRTTIQRPAGGGSDAITVHATATSFEGVTATASASTAPQSCPATPDWAEPWMSDNSEISGDSNDIQSSMELVYRRIKFDAKASVKAGDAWSANYTIEASSTDYLMVVPVLGWAEAGTLAVQLRRYGRAEVMGKQHDDAFIGGLHNLFANSSSNKGVAVVDQLDEVTTKFFDQSTDWFGVTATVRGRLREHGTGFGQPDPYAMLNYQVEVLGVFDGNDQPIDALICWASEMQ